MAAIEFGLSSFILLITNKEVYWFTDNQGAAHIVHKGSRQPTFEQ